MAGEHDVFFVVGRGRSGTTLLGRMLSGHPRVEVAPEGFFIMNLRARYGTGPWTEERVEAFAADLLVENRMRTWNLDQADVRARLRRALPGLDYPAACRHVYASYAATTRARPGVRLVGDKNPHYGLFVDRLQDLFTGARFVHIVRDPRDNVLSYKNVPFDLSQTAALAYRWRRYNEEILAAGRRDPGRMHRVSYEDLIADPERVLGEICTFLGERFAPSMLSFHDEEPEGFYGEGSPWFEKLGGPLDASQARKWESKMSDADIATVERICGSVMEELGYERTGRGSATATWRAGAAYGWATVTAEKLIFGAVPPHWRTWAINRYRSRTGRV